MAKGELVEALPPGGRRRAQRRRPAGRAGWRHAPSPRCCTFGECGDGRRTPVEVLAVDDAGRPEFDLVARRPDGARAAAAASASTRPPTPPPRPRWRWRSALDLEEVADGARPRPPTPPGGAWRSTSARDGVIGRQRRLQRQPRLHARRAQGAGRDRAGAAAAPAPWRCSERCASWASPARRSTTRSADWPCASTSPSSSWWAKRRGRSTWVPTSKDRGARSPSSCRTARPLWPGSGTTWRPATSCWSRPRAAVALERVAEALLEEENER